MYRKPLFAGIVAMALMSTNVLGEETKKETPKSLAFSMKSLSGEPVELSKYAGKVVLFVNVATKCGFTKQYAGLQKLHDEYAEKGLQIVGVPCNQFGGQEAGTSKEIQEFCTKTYSVKFDMMEKVNVNDDGGKKIEACDLYKYLTKADTKPMAKGPVKWNFEKFVLDRKGNVIGRFESKVEPQSGDIVKLIEKALSE
jgi:glutathione peroxidase